MYQRRSPLRVLNQEYPFILPQPIPEPPRVINPRPLVPDLSLTSDAQSCEIALPDKGRRLTHSNHDLYTYGAHLRGQPALPLKPTSPPVFARRDNCVQIQQTARNHTRSPLVVSHHRKENQLVSNQNKQPECGNQLYHLLKKHDEHLQIISQQIEELLRISNETNAHKQQRIQVKPKMCTAETMTSIEWPNQQRQPISSGKKANEKRSPPLVRETEPSRLPTIDETPKLKQRSTKKLSPGSTSPVEIEVARRSTRRNEDSSSDCFYDNMLANIDVILRESSVSESEGDFTRSSCSPTPPRGASGSRRHAQQQHIDRQQEQHYSEETIYINRLASKYLVTARRETPIRHHQERPEPAARAPATRTRTPSAKKDYDIRNYGTSREPSSIATKNYLEKYGLLNDQLNVSPMHSPRGGEPSGRHLPNGSRILDLDRLKRQPKYK